MQIYYPKVETHCEFLLDSIRWIELNILAGDTCPEVNGDQRLPTFFKHRFKMTTAWINDDRWIFILEVNYSLRKERLLMTWDVMEN